MIGLEIHVHIKSQTKLFSKASMLQYNYKLENNVNYYLPNNKVSFFDAAFPGTLPVLNKYCIEQTIKTGLALSSTINKYSTFDRKHYFYCDLPHSYQITQYYHPLVVDGFMNIELPNNQKKKINISKIQLEMDSGKLLHDQHPQFTLIDLNRAGIGMMEIVTQPDFRSSLEVGIFLRKLHHLIKYIGVSDANMEEGDMRCDINVSIHKPGTPLGNRCEIKNVNSIKFAIKAIDYEYKRQMELIKKGEIIPKETRFFNAKLGKTILSRIKEDEIDYRFFPDPDLPPLIIDESEINRIKSLLPELPDVLKDRLLNQYDLTPYQIDVIVNNEDIINYFEEVAKIVNNPKRAATWITNELFGLLNYHNLPFSKISITPQQIASIVNLQENNEISTAIGKQVLLLMFKGDKRNAKDIIEEKGWIQNSDHENLTELCKKILEESPKQIEEYKKGNKRKLRYFIGNIMKLSNGKANPQKATEIFEELLKEK